MSAEWPFSGLSAAMAAAVYDHHHEGILICDSLGRLIYYNRRMGELDGLEPGNVLGRHLLDIYHLNEDNCISTRCLASGRPVQNAALYYRATEGKLVNAICNAYPVYEKGFLAGVICYTAEYTSLADRLEITARNYARHPYNLAVDEESELKAANGAAHTLASIVGDSPPLRAALATARVAAKTPSSVMICGETGSGKELFAQAIHNHSPRKARPFCPINCAAIPENLLEGILFGTVRGAFTGAMDKKGLFEVSAGGTIFLDEINNMPMGLQVKLLRVIQERRIRRVGDSKETPVDLKIISATSQPPEEAVALGRLRADLFYRLGVVILPLPPLRHRGEDIALLIKFFVKKYNKKFHCQVRHIEPEFLSIMKDYRWPGNVRELEHVVETSMNFAAADPLNNTTLGLRHIQSAHLRKFLKRSWSSPAERRPDPQPPSPLADSLAQAEKEHLKRALALAEGNMSKAARRLGLSRQGFYYKMKKYNLKKAPDQAEED